MTHQRAPLVRGCGRMPEGDGADSPTRGSPQVRREAQARRGSDRSGSPKYAKNYICYKYSKFAYIYISLHFFNGVFNFHTFFLFIYIFFMKKLLPLVLLFVCLSQAKAADFYWKGGISGDFNDPNMWWVGSFGSGTTASQSPISSDNVFFTSAAFGSAGLFVDVASNASCNNMWWDAAILPANQPNLRCTNPSVNLDVHGNFTLTTNMVWAFQGNLRFTSVQPAGTQHPIITAGQRILVNSMVFEAAELVEYVLQDDLYVDDPIQANANLTQGTVILNGGYLNTNSKVVRLDAFISENNNIKRRLNISNSRVTLTRYHDQYAWKVDFNALLATPNFSGFQSAGSHIIQNGYYYTWMRFGTGIKYDTVTFDTEFASPIGDVNAFVYIDTRSSFDRDTFEHMFCKREIIPIYNNTKLIIKNLYLYPQTVFSPYSSAKTIEVENIINYSGCGEYATLGATAVGRPDLLTIKKITPGNLALNNVILARVVGDVSNGSTYTATNSVDQGSNTNISITGLVGREMYFRAIAGNQDWHNLANWQDNNLGVYTPSTCLPTPFDNVYFDGSSFNTNNRVEYTQRAYCRDMRWLPSIPVNARLSGGNILRIYGDLEYDSKMIFGNITGAGGNYRSMVLCGNAPNTITTNGAVNNNIQVILEAYSDYQIVGNYTGLINGGEFSRMRMGADTLRPTNTFYMHYGNFDGTQIYITNGSWAFQQRNAAPTAITYTGDATVHWQHTRTSFFYAINGAYLPNLIVYTRMPSSYTNIYVRGNLTLKEDATVYLGNTQIGGTVSASLRVIGGLNGAAGDVTLEAGSSLFFTSYGGTSSRLEVAGSFTALGTCTKPVTIATHDGQSLQGGVSILGAVNIDYANITGLPNISPAPNAMITATNSFDGGNNTNWNFVPGGSQIFYWRANSANPADFVGDWTEPAHWTTDPTSPVGDNLCIPTAVDDVVFDAMSFSGASNQCNVTNIVRCRDISVIAAARLTIGTASLYCRHLRFTDSAARLDGTLGSDWSPSQLHISGDLELAPNMTNMLYRGDINMVGSGNITSRGTKLQARQMIFDKVGGIWQLQDALFLDNDWALTNTTNRRAGAMILRAGHLHTNDSSVTISSYFASNNTTYARGLHLGSSIFTHRATSWYYIYWLTTLWNVNSTNFTLTSNSDAEINFMQANTFSNSLVNTRLDFYMGIGVNYPKVSIADSDQSVNIYNAANYKYLQLEANAYINDNNTMDSLRLEGGYFYRFRNTTVQTLNAPHGKIISNGTSSEFVNIESSSPGSTFRLHKPYGPAFCIDFVKVKDCVGTKETNMALVPTVPTNYQLIQPFLEFQTGVNSDNIGGTATGIWAFNLPLLVTPQYVGGNVVQPCAVTSPPSFNVPVTGTGPYLVNYTWTDGITSGNNVVNAADDDNNSSTPAFVSVPIHSGNASITYTFNVTTFRCGEETTPIPRTIRVQQNAPAVLTQTAQTSVCDFNNSPDWVTMVGDVDDRPIVSIQDYTGAADVSALGSVTTNVYFDASVQQVNIGGIMYPYLQRHWRITPTNNGAANVRLYFTQAELNALIAGAGATYGAFTSASQLQVVRYSSGTIGVGAEEIMPYTMILLTGAAAAPFSSTTNVYAFEFSVPSFSHFILTPTDDILLDNNLLDFTAQKQTEREVLLRWTVEKSINTDNYQIERSADGINAATIGELVSHRQSTPDHYTFTDLNPHSGFNYYRIRSIETDGTINFSPWRTVEIGNLAGEVKIFPNPANTQVNIRISTAQSVEVRLYNPLGQLAQLQIMDTPSQNHQINLQDLPAGIYTMQILLDNQAVSTHQLIVE
jgi:hypothetical protein